MPSRPEQLSSGRRAAAGRYPGERPDGKHVEYRCSAGTDIAHSPDPEQLSPRYGGEPIQTSWGALKQVAGSRQSYTQLRRAKCSKAIRPQIRDLNKQTYTTAIESPDTGENAAQVSGAHPLGVLRSRPPGRACSGSESRRGHRRPSCEAPAASAGNWDEPQPQQLPSGPDPETPLEPQPALGTQRRRPHPAARIPMAQSPAAAPGAAILRPGGWHVVRRACRRSTVAGPPPAPGACAARPVAAEPGQPAQRRGGGGGGWRQSAQLMNGTDPPGPSF